jgi:hypothetical protein
MEWPGGKRFAFTIFDDPDAQILRGFRRVYGFLSELGFCTTIGVWPRGPIREPNSGGETCASPSYLSYAQELQRGGFEIGYHNTTRHSSFREETREGLKVFRDCFGSSQITMSNHYNAEAIYWGQARLGGTRRTLYRAANSWRGAKFYGHIPESPYFWGDLCSENVLYCRNFAYPDVNTLRACPWMPYSDPQRNYVNYWYASAEGANVNSFVSILSEENQDRLEAEGGACIIYTHFGHGFVSDGTLDARVKSLLTRLGRKNGWFAPVATILNYLKERRDVLAVSDAQRRSMEWRWLGRKLLKGTS